MPLDVNWVAGVQSPQTVAVVDDHVVIAGAYYINKINYTESAQEVGRVDYRLSASHAALNSSFPTSPGQLDPSVLLAKQTGSHTASVKSARRSASLTRAQMPRLLFCLVCDPDHRDHISCPLSRPHAELYSVQAGCY